MANAMLAVNFVPNKFGRVRLEQNGYQYMVKTTRGDRRYWKCIVPLCPATINTHYDTVTKKRKPPFSPTNSKFLEIDGLLSTGNCVIRYIECYIDPVDVALVFMCFMIAYLVRKRRQLNRRLIKELAIMKVTCIHNDKVISGLQPYLEDARSKNSTLEMPLRRLARSCWKLDQDVDQKVAEIKGLSSQVSCFKNDWNNQAAPYYGTPLTTMLGHVEEAKIHYELKRLKMFIGKNLRFK
ncbi:unnamed protein product [Mytilus coruscus]|uniref:FLYWCH-type domain-containing protein n=1 Tax=Mytilus coruscus TaxID=42192 RepID=A0A6J8C702_MYTCO|nr:unnamed protein product [Mytilus coruscus]